MTPRRIAPLFATAGACAALAIALVLAPAQAPAQARPSLLADSARFRGAEWTVVPLVTLDSSRSADTTAIRQIGRTYLLGPGRIVFEGRLTRNGRWGLFGVVNGAVQRLLLFGVDFTEPEGERKRVEQLSEIRVVDGGLRVLAHARSGGRYIQLVSDGAAWRSGAATGDSATLDGTPVSVVGFQFMQEEADGARVALAILKDPKAEAIVRLRDRRMEKFLMAGDSIPGVGRIETSYAIKGVFGRVAVGMKQFRTTPRGWIALYRSGLGSGQYRDQVIAKEGAAEPRVVFTTEPWSKEYEGLSEITLLGAGEIAAQRGDAAGVIRTDGAWRPLVSSAEAKPPKNEVFLLSHVDPIDSTSNRALFSITFSRTDVFSSTSGVSVSTSWMVWPRLFYYDGEKASSVEADSGRTLRSMYMNVRPRPVIKRLPGYDGDRLAYWGLGMTGKPDALAFDAERVRLVDAPAFRTASGDIGLERLLGWSSETEAVVLWNGLALLRRP